jgi:hypothetical protein
MPTEPTQDGPTFRRRTVVGVALVLVLAIAFVYAGAGDARFCRIDDLDYITLNPFVRDGLTLEGLRHAFFASHAALWMPLAFTSHMIDLTLFGTAPGPAHVENVVLHAASTVLLLLLLVRTTGAVAASAAVAALFALHPLRVESVAWIAERKDVLSTFFALVTLHAWVDYARAPSVRRYGAVLVAATLALLSKPMMVTLPALLLLVDWWPLARTRRVPLSRLVVEKLPLVALAAATATITLISAHGEGSLASLGWSSPARRLAHATVAYVWYVWKTLWPTDLVIFYPMPTWSAAQVAGAAAVLVGAAAVAIVTRRRAPWIAVGLAWFAIALFPVVGFFQAGEQGMADRFTYVPSIGLLIAIVWTLRELARTRAAHAGLAVAAGIAVGVLTAASHRQAAYWHDDEALLRHGVAVDASNWFMHGNLGDTLLERGDTDEAAVHFAEALRLHPHYAMATFGLAAAHDARGEVDDAVAGYRETLKIDPTYWRAHNNLGIVLMANAEVDGALHHFSEALRLQPASDEVTSNLRAALGHMGLGAAEADGYLQGLDVWSAAIAADETRAGAAAYVSSLPGLLLGARADAVRACLGREGGGSPTPFSLYVAVDADGALEAITPVPPTTIARCLGAELRAARAPAPPFAPFHARVSLHFAS